jgi:hypothetical protein
MSKSSPMVFLVDVDDTLLENDRIQADLNHHIEREFGTQCRDRFWAIQGSVINFRANAPLTLNKTTEVSG